VNFLKRIAAVFGIQSPRSLEQILLDLNQSDQAKMLPALKELLAVARRDPNRCAKALPRVMEIFEKDLQSVQDFRMAEITADIIAELAAISVPQLISLLSHPDCLLASGAVELLAEINTPPAREALTRITIPRLRSELNSQDDEIREVSATTVGLLGELSKELIPEMISALEDPSIEVQLRALETIQYLKIKEARAAVSGKANSSTPFVAERAKRVLRILGSSH
jgi:HEAT repeat protein